jgi:hypothetical protein
MLLLRIWRGLFLKKEKAPVWRGAFPSLFALFAEADRARLGGRGRAIMMNNGNIGLGHWLGLSGKNLNSQKSRPIGADGQVVRVNRKTNFTGNNFVGSIEVFLDGAVRPAKEKGSARKGC